MRIPGDRIGSTRPNVGVDVTREPLGVIGLITPWNFPIAIPAWKAAPALAYGNCVVMKPADLVPASAHALAEIIAEAGVPKGVFNLVMGRGSVVGDALTSSPDVDAISFTGSAATGKKIAAACVGADPMKKFQLEMGGKIDSWFWMMPISTPPSIAPSTVRFFPRDSDVRRLRG